MNKNELVIWIKRLVGFLAIGLWLNIIYEISQMSVPFREQVPYCIGSSILIFSLLTVLHKGLDYWDIKNKKIE